MSQGKLVRDKIPQIIRPKGLDPVIHTACAEEYGARLRDKLREEVSEFLDSDSDPEELADVLQVVYALAEHGGTDRHQLERLRAAKADERGGLADRIIWWGNRPAREQDQHPISSHAKVQKVSKLTESAAGPRPASIISFVPASVTCATLSARRPPATRSPACSTYSTRFQR